MRYTINLSTRTYIDHKLINRVAGFLTVLLLVAFCWNVVSVSSGMGEESRLKSEIKTMQSSIELKPVGVSESQVALQKEDVRFYNEIIMRKTADWVGKLEMLENVTPEGISLSSFAPAKKDEEWKLDGYAKSFKTLQQYLEKLESSKSFTNVLLISHKNMESDTKIKVVQFTISCMVTN
ncbi:MAG: PilN domain-containing protein [Desulfuromonadaceae bacterium]|nr:PilN domain-containing protein [Desulfuromonadaceae bacterium]MDD2854511.1 PilN domain-containing protein [Desulfuromonadaceae bacterium]